MYREPQRGGGRQGYVAVARVTSIKIDPTDDRSSYAYVSDFLSFDALVPFRTDTGYFEARLNAVKDGSRVGAELRGNSIRTISDHEFSVIVLAGLAKTLGPANAERSEVGELQPDGSVRALIRAPRGEQERRIVPMLVHRPFRDAAFRTSVVEAYEGTCAVTGLRIVNGGGKVEVQAAHIWPVADGGPDIVPKRDRSIRHLPLAVRPPPHQPQGRLRTACVAQTGYLVSCGTYSRARSTGSTSLPTRGCGRGSTSSSAIGRDSPAMGVAERLQASGRFRRSLSVRRDDPRETRNSLLPWWVDGE